MLIKMNTMNVLRNQAERVENETIKCEYNEILDFKSCFNRSFLVLKVFYKEDFIGYFLPR